jgi:phage baseplate assembly protein W
MVGDPAIYDPTLDMWPDLRYGRIVLSPVRIGMDRTTGRVLTGWDHVIQSMLVIFSTKYHERVLRRWCGSFVPHLIGENANEATICRFYWAIATSIDLWEPNYRIQRVRVGKRSDGSILTSPEELRTGHLTTSMDGVYRPRGHLGNDQPQVRRAIGLVSRGYNLWERQPGLVAGAPAGGIGTTPNIPPGSVA